eukprot:augustus_masked-scaffold_11-processed-gene-7.56-mRNA-1 protein AED:1.00 eAED:1.00 QI:0/-1/0/0/-1/1/1/0/542
MNKPNLLLNTFVQKSASMSTSSSSTSSREGAAENANSMFTNALFRKAKKAPIMNIFSRKSQGGKKGGKLFKKHPLKKNDSMGSLSVASAGPDSEALFLALKDFTKERSEEEAQGPAEHTKAFLDGLLERKIPELSSVLKESFVYFRLNKHPKFELDEFLLDQMSSLLLIQFLRDSKKNDEVHQLHFFISHRLFLEKLALARDMSQSEGTNYMKPISMDFWFTYLFPKGRHFINMPCIPLIQVLQSKRQRENYDTIKRLTTDLADKIYTKLVPVYIQFLQFFLNRTNKHLGLQSRKATIRKFETFRLQPPENQYIESAQEFSFVDEYASFLTSDDAILQHKGLFRVNGHKINSEMLANFFLAELQNAEDVPRQQHLSVIRKSRRIKKKAVKRKISCNHVLRRLYSGGVVSVNEVSSSFKILLKKKNLVPDEIKERLGGATDGLDQIYDVLEHYAITFPAEWWGFERLISLLKQVVEYKEHNSMSSKSVAICFVTCLLERDAESAQSIQRHILERTGIIQKIIDEVEFQGIAEVSRKTRYHQFG